MENSAAQANSARNISSQRANVRMSGSGSAGRK